MTQNKKDSSPTLSGRILKPLSSAPAELKAFIVFALAAVLIHFVVMFFCPFEIRRLYADKAGALTGSVYMFSLLFVFMPVYSDSRFKLFGILWGIVTPMIIRVLIACLTYLNIVHDGGAFVKSGYWGLVWSVIIPTVWTLVIVLSPRISKFYKNISNSFVKPIVGLSK